MRCRHCGAFCWPSSCSASAFGFVIGHLAWDIPAALVALVVLVDLVRGLRRGVLGVDIIALLAILGAIALDEHLASVIIALMVAGGSALEEFAAARARRELAALVGRTPHIAHRHTEDRFVDVPVDTVQPNDVLLIKPGEIVPVDGIVATEAATLDELALTGEPLPVARTQGDPVRSGVVNAAGPFELRVTATAVDSTYAAVVRLVHAAERERPPLVRLADCWALAFVALTVVLGGGAWWMTGDALRALAVLVVATPCPLILAAPVALICGVSRAARRGIIVKGGGVLERLARARTVLFDKTGTLTTGTPRVTGVETLHGHDADAVLHHAASLAQVSQHAVAGSIVAAARSLGLPLVPPHDVEEIPGGGLAGMVGDVRVLVGSAGLLDAAGIPPPTEGATARMAAAAASVAWVAFDGSVAGALLLADRIRPETPRALRALRAAGVTRLVMVSGDRPASAEARRIGAGSRRRARRPLACRQDRTGADGARAGADCHGRRWHQRRAGLGGGRCRRRDGRARCGRGSRSRGCCPAGRSAGPRSSRRSASQNARAASLCNPSWPAWHCQAPPWSWPHSVTCRPLRAHCSRRRSMSQSSSMHCAC